MQTQLNEIPASQWAHLLDQFSRTHHGQRSEIVIIAPDAGRHQQAHELPLLGISSEPADGGPRITIVAADGNGTHMTHQIEHPTRVRFAEWNDGVSAELDIDSDDGFCTTLRVGPADETVPPGVILDGNYPRP